MAIHSSDAKLQLRNFHIGSLEGKDEDRAVVKSDEPEPIEPVFLHKSKWKSAKLVRRPRPGEADAATGREDARLARLAAIPLRTPDARAGARSALRSARLLPSPTQGVGAQRQVRILRVLGPTSAPTSPIGSADPQAYTPVSAADAKGFIDLLIKVYLPSGKFAGGRMTVGFDELELDDTIELKGPLGSFIWKGKGVACACRRCGNVADEPGWRGVDRPVKKIGLISAGSGPSGCFWLALTLSRYHAGHPGPAWRPARRRRHDDQAVDGQFEQSVTTCRLPLTQRAEEVHDILCREELDALAADHGHRFSLHHTLSKPPAENWTYSKGRITLQMLRDHLPPPDPETLIVRDDDAALALTISTATLRTRANAGGDGQARAHKTRLRHRNAARRLLIQLSLYLVLSVALDPVAARSAVHYILRPDRPDNTCTPRRTVDQKCSSQQSSTAQRLSSRTTRTASRTASSTSSARLMILAHAPPAAAAIAP